MWDFVGTMIRFSDCLFNDNWQNKTCKIRDKPVEAQTLHEDIQFSTIMLFMCMF